MFVLVDFDWKFCLFLLLHHEAKFGRVYPLQKIVWSERGDFISGDLSTQRPGIAEADSLGFGFDLPQIAVVGGQSVGKSLGINDEDADCVGLRKSAHEATKDRGVWLVVIVCVF